MSDSTTRIACLTPAGAGAIATLAVRGPRAWDEVRALFRTGVSGSALPEQPELGRFWLGRLGAEIADEVVIAVKRWRPAPWVEIHSHGGAEVVRLLMESFADRGVQVCTWEALDAWSTGTSGQASAAIALAYTSTTRTAAILLDQYHGAFEHARQEIVRVIQAGDHPQALAGLEALARYSKLGRHLKTPWRVAVLGAPNVGKSSLVNALAGFQRSVVAATPGTTRDVLTTALAIDGWPIELCDTAGLRDADELLESEGIRRARAAATEADLCLWLLDASTTSIQPDFELTNLLFVISKCDLSPEWSLADMVDAVRVSARTGDGLAELCRAMARRLVPDPPPPGTAIPFTESQFSAIEGALASIGRGDTATALMLLSSRTSDLVNRDS